LQTAQKDKAQTFKVVPTVWQVQKNRHSYQKKHRLSGVFGVRVFDGLDKGINRGPHLKLSPCDPWPIANQPPGGDRSSHGPTCGFRGRLGSRSEHA